MPELPEVEIARRNLRRWALHATVERALVPATRIVRGSTASKVRAALEGRRIESIDRRGKWIRIAFDDGGLAFTHLGMSGKWVRRSVNDETQRWERLRLDVKKSDRRTSLRYVDPRMFGHFLVAREEIAAWRALGPDPLIDGVDGKRLHDQLAKRRVPVKVAIMDQRVIAGVGNIQATESLFHARVDPRRKASTISAKEASAIAKGIVRAIEETLAHEDGDEITYVEEAGAPNPFRIYGHAGEPCPRCKSTLVRETLGGRTSAYCPRCQK